jgi:hypothetical protein
MTVEKEDYEELLSIYSSTLDAIELLRLHRPYLELMPSMRRSEESLITMPLPIDREAQEISTDGWGSIWCNKYI